MAKQRSRGKIAIRTDRLLVIHPATEPVIHWCSVCQCDSAMVIPEHAARRWDTTIRTVYRWMDAGTVHFLEVAGGVLVCLKSIKT